MAQPEDAESPSGRLGVVIATRNRAFSLLETLERLASLPERPAVIVVDNASSDGTPEIVRFRFPDVRLIALDRNRSAAARNIGVETLECPYIAFCDDDSWWSPGSLTRAAEILEMYPRLGLVAGEVVLQPKGVPDPICEQMLRSPLSPRQPLPGPSVLGFIACGAVVRKEAFIQAGGFRERYGVGGEEELLAIDMAAEGWGLSYVPDVIAYHQPSAHRDARRRQDIVARNALWTTWLRRPAQVALLRTARFLIGALASRSLRRVVWAAAGLTWTLKSRRVVPAWLEQDLRLLE
jgi:N-acetylglucosaminyl-diphospho-decaprenol L-rhamnosyltransferase